jgi:hypothetical protein
MSDGPTLYDEDILLWSEQQAEAIRKLGRRRDLPNEFDVENVAEEIESVGRSELAAVKSQIRLIFTHLIKLAVEPDSDAVRHWRGKLVAFHSEMTRRYAPSMRRRIDLDELWRSALEQLKLAYEGTLQEDRVAGLPMRLPFALGDLIGERIDSGALVERLRQSRHTRARSP